MLLPSYSACILGVRHAARAAASCPSIRGANARTCAQIRRVGTTQARPIIAKACSPLSRSIFYEQNVKMIPFPSCVASFLSSPLQPTLHGPLSTEKHTHAFRAIAFGDERKKKS